MWVYNAYFQLHTHTHTLWMLFRVVGWDSELSHFIWLAIVNHKGCCSKCHNCSWDLKLMRGQSKDYSFSSSNCTWPSQLCWLLNLAYWCSYYEHIIHLIITYVFLVPCHIPLNRNVCIGLLFEPRTTNLCSYNLSRTCCFYFTQYGSMSSIRGLITHIWIM